MGLPCHRHHQHQHYHHHQHCPTCPRHRTVSSLRHFRTSSPPVVFTFSLLLSSSPSLPQQHPISPYKSSSFDQPGSSHHENLAPLKHLGRLRASSSTTISSSSTYTFSFASSSLSSPSLSSSQQQNRCKIVTIINFLTKGSYSSTNHIVMSFSIPDAPLVNPICSPAFSE